MSLGRWEEEGKREKKERRKARRGRWAVLPIMKLIGF
jgi:hypothetical protein